MLQLIPIAFIYLSDASDVVLKYFYGNENKLFNLLTCIPPIIVGLLFFFCTYYYLIFETNWWDSIKGGIFFFIKQFDRLLWFIVSFIPLIFGIFFIIAVVFRIEGSNSKHIMTYIVLALLGLLYYAYYRLSTAVLVKDIFGIAPPKKNIKHKERRGK